jgi:hypothetical protein
VIYNNQYATDNCGKRLSNYMNTFIVPFYLQSVPVRSANCVKSCTIARRRVLSSDFLQLVGSRSLVAFENETYELNPANYDCKYDNYTRNLVVGRQIICQVSPQSPVVWL